MPAVTESNQAHVAQSQQISNPTTKQCMTPSTSFLNCKPLGSLMCAHIHPHLPTFSFSLLIFSSSHLLIFSSSHLLIFSSSPFLTFSSSHLLPFSLSHLSPSSPFLTFSLSHLLTPFIPLFGWSLRGSTGAGPTSSTRSADSSPTDC